MIDNVNVERSTIKSDEEGTADRVENERRNSSHMEQCGTPIDNIIPIGWNDANGNDDEDQSEGRYSSQHIVFSFISDLHRH